MSLTILRRLPTLEVLQRRRRATPKGVLRVVERQAKKATQSKCEREAKADVWARAKGRCERCGRWVTRGVDSLAAGHVHHRRKRSQGGTWQAKDLICLCTFCHREVHS